MALPYRHHAESDEQYDVDGAKQKDHDVSSFARDSLSPTLRGTIGQPNHPDGVVVQITGDGIIPFGTAKVL
jgi:hypothetical protein